VLVAEDGPHFAALAGEDTGSSRHEALEADNGERAGSCFANAHPDVVITDWVIVPWNQRPGAVPTIRMGLVSATYT